MFFFFYNVAPSKDTINYLQKYEGVLTLLRYWTQAKKAIFKIFSQSTTLDKEWAETFF